MAESHGHERPDDGELEGATGGADRVDDLIVEESGRVLRGYVMEQIHTEEPTLHVRPEDLGGTTEEVENPQIKGIVEQLLKIAEELNQSTELRQLLSTVEANCAQEMFMTVARRIFQDGINWGRVVALLHLAYRLIHKALTQNRAEIIKNIISWVLQFIREHICSWIRQQGGWEAVIRNMSQRVPWGTVSIIAAIAFTMAAVYWKRTH